jgi:hypothetical protein
MVSTSSRPRLCATLSATMLVGSCILAVAPSTAEQRQLGAHEHGAAALNVAVSDSTLSIEFTAPAVNLVGFEHTATTEDQVQAIAQAEELLASGRVLGLPESAQCELTASNVEHETEGEHADEDHEKEHADDDHEKEHEGEEKSHSEFHALLTYDCQNIEALTHIDVEIFLLFPGNKEIHTQVITTTGQSGGELTPDAARLVLP